MLLTFVPIYRDGNKNPDTSFCQYVIPRDCGTTNGATVALCFHGAEFFSAYSILPLPFLHAVRVGEAKNPGPHHDFRVCLVNPTAIFRKAEVFHELSTTYGIDTFCISETSATLPTQKILSSQMNKHRFKTLWTNPVEEHTQRIDGKISLRGKAAGVALMSRRACRHALGTIPDQWTATCRILHSVVSVAQLQIQIITIYGVTASHRDALAFNSDLLKTAFEASRQLLLPTLIVGDWNCDPKSLASWGTLEAEGFSDLKILHQRLFGREFPNTCKEATSPDNALCCPKFAQWISNIEVTKDYHFDAHKCVLVSFRIPGDSAFTHVLPMPKTWLNLPIEAEFIQQSYQEAVLLHGTPINLQEWGSRVEQAVDLAYQRTQALDPQNCEVKTLPANMKGRCKPRAPRKLPLRFFSHVARNGDYIPAFELHSFRSKRMVKQVRRLQSLYRNISKGIRPDATNWQSWQEQWNAILKDR